MVLNIVFLILIVLLTNYLFEFLIETFALAFGEILSNSSQLFIVQFSLILSVSAVFALNAITYKSSFAVLGLCLGVGLFLVQYLWGPGLLAPTTVFRAFVSFPYNVNMFAILLLPIVMGLIIQQSKN